MLSFAVHASLHNPLGNGKSNCSLFLSRHRRRRVSSSQNNTMGQGKNSKGVCLIPRQRFDCHCDDCRQVDIRVLSVETHLAGRIYPGDRKDLIAYMEKVMKKMTMTMIMTQVGYRHIHWAHQSTNPNRSEMGTTDDLFVRKDIPLVKEEGGEGGKEALREKLGENDMEELANDVTEQLEHLLDSGKMDLLQKAEREDL